jgi:hypothetical protein
MKAIVAFDAKSPHVLAPLLKRGYWHVWCALFHEPSQLWIVHDATRIGIEIYPMTNDMLAHQLTRANDIYALDVDPSQALKLPTLINTCVGHTKITLGLRSAAVTPYQLRSYLHARSLPERTSVMSRIADLFRSLDLRLPGGGEGGGGGGGGGIGTAPGGYMGPNQDGSAGFSIGGDGGITTSGGTSLGNVSDAIGAPTSTTQTPAQQFDSGDGPAGAADGAAAPAAPTPKPVEPTAPAPRPAIARPVTGNAGRRPVRNGGPANVRNIGGAAGISLDNLSRALKALTGQ